MKNTVAIIGSHPRTRAEFSFERDDCDIWLFNEAISNKTFPRADAIFQMHEEAIWRNPANRNDPHHIEWLKSQNEIDIYMQARYEDVPKSIRYPLDEITDKFKVGYFTSSVAYALALACYHGYKRIEIYGVEMETNTEYQYQRDGVTLWIGIALGLGIEVDAHMSIFDAPLYGYEGEVVIDYNRFDERIAELMPTIDGLSREYTTAYMNTQQAARNFAERGGDAAEKTLYECVQKQVEAGERLGIFDGAKQENQRYKKKADVMRSETGGKFLFSRQEFESSAKNLNDKTNEAHTEYITLGTTLGHIHRNLMQAAKGSPKREKLLQLYQQTLEQYMKASNQSAVYKGAAQENLNYMGWLDKHIRAAGGAKSEAVLLEALQNG